MARRDYSVVLLFQLAAWTTLQFWWLQVAAMIALSFLKCALHSTLPPIGTATIAHGFKKNCEGGGREDRGAVGRVGAVAVWHRGGRWGGSLGVGTEERR